MTILCYSRSHNINCYVS